jgi:ABC-2 type transport system permease protein
MTRLIRAELLKLRTVRSFWLSVVAVLAFVPVTIAMNITGAGAAGDLPLDSGEGVRNVMSAASSGSFLFLVIGIVIMAGEFRHDTATSTFLVAPDRRRVVGAKLAAGALAGAVVAVAASLVTLAVGLPWLAARDVDVTAYGADVALALLGSIAGTAVCGLLGVGLGSLLRNQTAAITVTLVWVFTVEALLVVFAPGVGRWLPGGAGSALSGASMAEGGLLPVWAAALVLAGYGLAFAAAGARLVVRRDIA